MPGLKLARVAAHGHQLADRLVIGTHVATRVLEHRPGRLEERLHLGQISIVSVSRDTLQVLPTCLGHDQQFVLSRFRSGLGKLLALPLRDEHEEPVRNSLQFALLHSREDGFGFIIRNDFQCGCRQFGEQFRTNAQVADRLSLCNELLHGTKLKQQ